MDHLSSAMELLNSTPSPLSNAINQVTNSSSDPMEPNNLSQPSARETDTVSAVSGEATPVTQAFVERNLELKLPILSSSSSDSESEGPSNLTAGTSAGADAERVASPPPNCAICLGRCKNKCFTDSCMHQFCFKCLCEWSKVKPECPLCKQTFKSIIHNVKSIHQFEEYHVQPPTVQIAHPPFEMDFQEMRIFGVVHPGRNRNHAWNEATHRPFFYGDFSTPPYSTASTGGSIPSASGSSSNRSIASSVNSSVGRNQFVYRELLDLYRREYPGAIANSGTLSQLWRRYVYDRKLYALPVADITGRFRESSARFYRDNPSQVHRLMPWINRDIVCLLRHTEHDVTTVLESINSALTLMNILSPAFRRRLQIFLGTKTAHFIHELNNFARSPYDMIGYDRAVQYLPQTNNDDVVIEFTSSDESTDNDQIDVAGDGGNSNTTSTSRSRSTNASSTNAINLTIHNRLTSASANSESARGAGTNDANNGGSLDEVLDDISLVIDLRGESDNNETTSTAQATTNSSNYQNNQIASASEGDVVTSGSQPTLFENIELTSGSSDECEFVLERKPPHLRTPEMVSLDSASDSDVVFVEESKPLNKTSFSSSEEELNASHSDHKQNSRHHNKIAALVEAKKRNQSANLVKSEQQESHSEVYNLGASTSAALRLSLQKRLEKSHRSDERKGSRRLSRDKYSLRNSDSQSIADRLAHKGRRKRLSSESDHSSTSSSTTISSSSSSTTSTNSSSNSSDEDYVATTSKRKESATARRALGTRKFGRNSSKTKTCKTKKSTNRRMATRDSKKQKNAYSSDDDDDDEEENSLIGKNLALAMAVNERRKRQEQKNSGKAQEDEEESDEENSWRLKAVNEPLRKQPQQQNKSSYKSNERKRKRKAFTQQHQQQAIENKNIGKRQKCETKTQQDKKTKKTLDFLNSDDSTSDESDNINLIQLKTKLIGQDCHKELRIEQTNTNQTAEPTSNFETDTTINDGNSENFINATFTSSSISINTGTATTVYVTTTEHATIPTAVTRDITNSPSTNQPAEVGTTTNETTNNIAEFAESMATQNELFHFSDYSDDNVHDINEHRHIDNNNQESINNYQHDQQQIPSSSITYYHGNNNDNPPHHKNDTANNDATHDAIEDDLCDDDETFSNIPTTMNLTESNVFADGTSMSTTTTDTILHEAAEQISSAAVNFYNPQQIFNTADFADENSSNSSSSDSSNSSSATSLSSSNNSSSSNTNSYRNYDHS